jgi:glycosyltransferase involved in cell wall biosynthesis
MRTVLFVEAFSELVGGLETALLSLLDALDRDRFRPVVALPGDGDLTEELRRRGVSILVEPRLAATGARIAGLPTALFRPLDSLRAVRSLVREARTLDVALVHAYSIPALKHAAAVAAVCRVPAVASLFDSLAPPLRAIDRRIVATLLNLGFDRVVVPSEAVRGFALRYRVDPAKLIVRHDGVDPHRFKPDPAAGARVRAELGLDLSDQLIGTVGRLVPSKGHDVLLRATAALVREWPSLRCLIVGEPRLAEEREWKRRLVALVEELDLGDRARFVGWRGDVPAVLAALDVLVQPVRFPDPFPRAVLEAMAVGRPVVATAMGGLPEAIEDGVSGFLVSRPKAELFAAALRRLLADPIAAEAMGAASRARVVARFAAGPYARAMEDIYTRLLEDMEPGRWRRMEPAG